MFCSKLATPWWAQARWAHWRTLHKLVSQNRVEIEKADNLEHFLSYYGLDCSAWVGDKGDTAEGLWKQKYSITARAWWLIVLWKVSFDNTMACKRLDGRDVQDKEILKAITKGNETKAINLSTLLQNNPMGLSLHKSKDWESTWQKTEALSISFWSDESDFGVAIGAYSLNVLFCHAFKTKILSMK